MAGAAAAGGSGSCSVRCSTPEAEEVGEAPAAVGAGVDLAAVVSVVVAADSGAVLEAAAALEVAAQAAVGKRGNIPAGLIANLESLLVFRHPKNRWLTQLCMTH